MADFKIQIMLFIKYGEVQNVNWANQYSLWAPIGMYMSVYTTKRYKRFEKSPNVKGKITRKMKKYLLMQQVPFS